MATESPLLPPPPAPNDDDDEETAELERSLRRLESFLRWIGFCQYLAASFSLSWLLLLVVGIGAPAAIVQFYYCSSDYADFTLKLTVRDCFRDFSSLLAIWILPCFLLKVAREILRTIYVPTASIWEAITTLVVSWTYSSTVNLTGSLLFNLVCVEEHMRLTYCWSKISHRFRIFLILEFVVVIASEFVALLETTGNSDIINFINRADFAIK